MFPDFDNRQVVSSWGESLLNRSLERDVVWVWDRVVDQHNHNTQPKCGLVMPRHKRGSWQALFWFWNPPSLARRQSTVIHHILSKTGVRNCNVNMRPQWQKRSHLQMLSHRFLHASFWIGYSPRNKGPRCLQFTDLFGYLDSQSTSICIEYFSLMRPIQTRKENSEHNLLWLSIYSNKIRCTALVRYQRYMERKA